jgi:hypothetical protein
MPKHRKPPKRKKPETRGRPEIPPELRKVNLVCRVPSRVRDGFKQRASAAGMNARGAPNSSVGLEVERAFDATATAAPPPPNSS